MSDQGPTVFNDRYELHRKLARGGMSDVYLARDQLLDRPVAVKVLFPEYAKDETFVERFRREAQAAANLNHPNIVAIYDWGQQGGTYFIVMEYIEGRSLSEIIRADGPLHPRRAAEITADVAAALGFAHRNGVVHRDVKPGNILISPSGQVKVADFGIAQAVTGGADQSNLTQAGSVMGTATYFSPEQAQGKPVDPRSDLYSLGCVLFEMLTCRPPFSGDTPVAIAYKHVQEPAPLPSTLGIAVPTALEAIVAQMLAKSVSDRYASAEDLRADLRNYLEGLPVAAMHSAAALAAGVAVGAAAIAGATAAGAATQAVPSVGAAVVDPGSVPPGGVAPTTGYTSAYSAPEPEQKGRSSVFLWVLLGLLLVVAAGLFYFGTRLNQSKTQQVEVPSVVNQTAEAATTTLEGAGFQVQVKTEPNSDVKQGIVFAQSPNGNTKADKNSTVIITVSAGLGQGDVPSVTGLTKAAATSLLENNGFVVNAVDQNDPKVAVGTVISQEPAGGQKADKGSVVTINVSSGPSAVTIPDVTGQSAATASANLTSLGFKVSETEQSSTSVASGRVIGTNPAAGKQATPGSVITIIVSTGPPATTTSTTTAPASTTTTAAKKGSPPSSTP
ncbi:MAG TPA: Stk1 family PASTA domain-containing Ser/Thr kinase [Acidimicrobiales bacterium]